MTKNRACGRLASEPGQQPQYEPGVNSSIPDEPETTQASIETEPEAFRWVTLEVFTHRHSEAQHVCFKPLTTDIIAF